MDDTMAPPSKRRKLLDVAEAPAEASEPARTFVAPYSHGVQHIPTGQPTQVPVARSPPHHVEEVHLQIHKRSIVAAEDRLRVLKRQGTAALTDIISTNSNADVVVAVTASVDALGSTTALATAAVTVDMPDLGSLLSTSSTTVISDTTPKTTSSASPASSAEPSSSDSSISSKTASSPDASRASSASSAPAVSGSSTSTSSDSQQTYAISPASESSDDSVKSQSRSSTSTGLTESTTSSSVDTSSTASTISESNNVSSTQIASLSAYTSSNSSMLASSSGTSGLSVTSGYLSQTGSSSPNKSLNLTTSASTSTSGSAVLVSVVTVSSTSSSDSQATDSSSSIDLNALYLATQSNGDVTTITRSDEPFTTSLADGQAATVSPSSSGSVTVISSDGSTVRSTVFSTASPSSTQSSSDEPNGVGLAGVAGDGATATSGGASSTTSPAKNNGDDDNAAPAGTIAGGVVGGAAGLVLVGLIILLFLRRYKKRVQLGHQALPANSAGPLAGSDAGTSSSGPGMAERAGLMPFVGAVPALFRHQNRQSESETGERGFQRVSGRKLPSAFSEGMAGPPHPPTSPPPTMPLVSLDDGDRNLSSLSFYRDSAGFYGGDGSSTSPNPFSDTNIPATIAKNEAAEQLIMSPGPQRRPTIHAPKSNVQVPSVATSGTPSWTPSHTATFARSETPTSLDSGRNSRFTEEV